jgi:hypothetical protein
MYKFTGDELISDSYLIINDNFDETVLINSTTETATNQKWIDGKPIYRKVFEVDDAELDSELMTQIPLNIDSPETMTNLFATLEFGTSTQPSIINIGSFWANSFDLSTAVAIRIICYTGNLMISKQGTNSTSYKNLRITIEFTKTTD